MPSVLTRPPMDLEVIVPAPWSSAMVVVDNDSADSTLDVPGRFADAPVSVHTIGCSDHGKGAAVRRGIATVIASRRAPGAHYEIEQSAPRRCGGWVFRRLTLPGIADTQCGLLARMMRDGHDVVEVPVAWSDVPGLTFSAVRHGLRSMADLVRISLSRW
ncbi:hypothetical protein HRW10_27065 [Streptomyces lunaelactis]|nr:hypothetical protein [Streptomyces lunaelactis]